MLTYGSSSYVYTKRGSLSMKVEGTDTTRYTYDLMGNLIKVELPTSDEVEYLIDAQNRRVGKKLNGQVVAQWVYSGQLAPVAEMDSTGVVVARYIYATHVNVPDYIVKNDSVYRVVTDHLGSVRLVLNQATGAVMERMDYDAWGNVLADSDPGFTPFGYAGGLYETQTTLIRFGERDYNAPEARWTGKDPIGFSSGDTQLYQYCGNDPVNHVDIEGRSKGGKQRIHVGDLGPNSDPKLVRKALKEAIREGKSAEHIGKLRGLLKVAQRNVKFRGNSIYSFLIEALVEEIMVIVSNAVPSSECDNRALGERIFDSFQEYLDSPKPSLFQHLDMILGDYSGIEDFSGQL
jgi:RHS repeat-associated protein